MARNFNTVPSIKLTLSTTEKVKAYLMALVETGVYGKNASEAAERLVGEMIQQKLAAGFIPRNPTLDPK